jgi:hypothetical protein
MAESKFNWIKFSSSVNNSLPGFNHNVNFPLRVWRQVGKKEARGVVIMISGFLEGLKRSADGIELPQHYSAIAEALRNQNYIVVLLPLPFHFERSLDFPMEGTLAPLLRLDNSRGGSGSFVYFGGYTQIKEDIIQLCKLLEQKSKPGFDKLKISKNPEYHLLGYSLGGVMALGMLLEDNASVKFTSTSILLSNYNIAEISSNQIKNAPEFRGSGFNGEIWNRILDDLKNSRANLPSFFRFLIWGEDEKVFKERLVELSNDKIRRRLLFLNGMQDDLFDLKKVNTRNNNLFKIILENERIKSIVTLIMTTSKHRIKQETLIAKYISAFISNE